MTGASDVPMSTDTVGRLFVEALNAGLARARAALPGPAGHPGPRAEPWLPDDPFATAVLVCFDGTLPGTLTSTQRHDVTLQAVMRRRAEEIVAAAVQRTTRQSLALPEAPSGLSSAHETLVRTLLLECAALTVAEKRRFPVGTVRPADLVRELGRALRTSQHRPARAA
ncbi:hypothetical protein AB0F77_31780 [Streptomyces sp. NPDC026672]|uniref:hypothetical protein n=1 Tax=unclassified Streptomyces TaxID=2593676 RepID=UPI0034102335